MNSVHFIIHYWPPCRLCVCFSNQCFCEQINPTKCAAVTQNLFQWLTRQLLPLESVRQEKKQSNVIIYISLEFKFMFCPDKTLQPIVNVIFTTNCSEIKGLQQALRPNNFHEVMSTSTIKGNTIITDWVNNKWNTKTDVGTKPASSYNIWIILSQFVNIIGRVYIDFT